MPLKLPNIPKKNSSTFHLYVVLLKKNNRDLLYKLLLKNGFKTNVHYIPIYKHPYFKKFNFLEKNFRNNEKYFKNAISLPIHPGLTKKNIFKIINVVKNFFN